MFRILALLVLLAPLIGCSSPEERADKARVEYAKILDEAGQKKTAEEILQFAKPLEKIYARHNRWEDLLDPDKPLTLIYRQAQEKLTHLAAMTGHFPSILETTEDYPLDKASLDVLLPLILSDKDINRRAAICYNLSRRFFDGEGVVQSFFRAEHYALLAFRDGENRAAQVLINLYYRVKDKESQELWQIIGRALNLPYLSTVDLDLPWETLSSLQLRAEIIMTEQAAGKFQPREYATLGWRK